MKSQTNGHEGGFSLIELMIALAVTLMLMSAAVQLLAAAFNTRTREDRRSDAIADASRALNIMSREISNAGFNLTTNGIVAGDSTLDANNNNTIRIRANLNKYDSTVSLAAQGGISQVGEDAGEDVKFFLTPTASTTYLVRYDAMAFTNDKTVLANRIDRLRFGFYDERVTYTATGAATACDNASISNIFSSAQNSAGANEAQVTPDNAKYVVIAVCVELPAVGKPGGSGYQPPSRTLLTSDVALRNANVTNY